jgi:predicted transcriptional regulator
MIQKFSHFDKRFQRTIFSKLVSGKSALRFDPLLVRLDDDLEKKLEETAKKLQRTKGWIINEALRQYIARDEQKLRMLEQTEEAIADIEAQRVISGEEVIKWLETWGTTTEDMKLKFSESAVQDLGPKREALTELGQVST